MDFVIPTSQQYSADTNDLRREQFERERDMNDSIWLPDAAVVLGVGGIGSHVAEILGSCRSCRAIIVFDDDKVEISNLNRTAYTLDHVGMLKVQAIQEIITRRNTSVSVIPIPQKFRASTIEGLDIYDTRKMFWERVFMRLDFFDCRDDDYQDHDLYDIFAKKIGYHLKVRNWRASYNGLNITLDGEPEKHPTWGQTGYTVIPSHSIPSRMVALLVVLYSTLSDVLRTQFQSLDSILTFDCRDILRFILDGISLHRWILEDRELGKRLQQIIRFSSTDNLEERKQVVDILTPIMNRKRLRKIIP